MSNTLFSSDLLARLRRSVLLGTVALFAFTAAACGGDDDDDDISGPLADCIDDIDFDDWFFEENDLETLSLGDSESGSISTSDVELEFNDGIRFYDVYAFSVESESDLRITVDPSGDFDPTFEVYDLATDESDFNDNGGSGDTEEVDYEGVPEGCYLLFVSGFDVEETGSYSVEVDEI